jgi:Fur family ferric uptake transcriptional regulator
MCWPRPGAVHPGVGRATVYRTLDLLTKLGITRPSTAKMGVRCSPPSRQGHQHAVCSRCDRVVELNSTPFAQLARQVARRTGFAIQSQLLEFYGLCRSCQRVTQTART